MSDSITTEFICTKCNFRGTTDVLGISDRYIKVKCPECNCFNAIPRDSVYLASFEPQGMIKDTPPTAEVTITHSISEFKGDKQ